jgi:hypothetical protein
MMVINKTAEAMKNKLILLTATLLGLFLFSACEKEDGPVIGEKNSFIGPQITTPSTGSSLILLKNNAENTVLFRWSLVNYGVPVGVQYILQADLDGNNFASPMTLATSSNDSAVLTIAGLNTKFTAMNLTPNSVNTIELRVMAYVPKVNLDTLYSSAIDWNVTPYLAKDPLFLVGSYNGWDANGARRLYQNLTGMKYEIYLYMPDNTWGFKFLPTQGSWAGDMGDDPNNPGHLIAEGEGNCGQGIAAGYYRIQADLGAMTWSATPYSWAIIVSAPGDGWSADHNMTYDQANDVWTITIDLIAGAFKFRGNGSWDFNYGDTGADGTLEPGGSDISIPSAGNYTITLNLKPPANPVGYYSYTITKN